MGGGEALNLLRPCDSCPQGVTLTMQLTEMEHRLGRIDKALFGDGSKPGIIEHVETLVTITHVGRSTFKVFAWFGGIIMCIITGAYQVKQFFTMVTH